MKAIKNTRRAVSIIVAALVVALTATGCARTSGAAAMVNGERVEIDEVQGAFEIMSVINGTNPANHGQPNVPAGNVSQQGMIFFLVVGPTVVEVAERAGVEVLTRNESSTMLSNKLRELGYSPQVLAMREGAIDYLRYDYAYTMLSKTAQDGNAKPFLEAVEAIKKLDITVNPRYGQFDWSTMDKKFLPTSYELNRPWLVGETPVQNP